MNPARKLILLFTLFSYLAASSVASAHGFSGVAQDSEGSPASQIVEMSDPHGIDCHSSETSSGEESNSTACKIFCSVMAQAVASAASSISLDAKPLAGASTFSVSVISRQLAVETHPPK